MVDLTRQKGNKRRYMGQASDSKIERRGGRSLSSDRVGKKGKRRPEEQRLSLSRGEIGKKRLWEIGRRERVRVRVRDGI
jgi:hypothetical protein